MCKDQQVIPTEMMRFISLDATRCMFVHVPWIQGNLTSGRNTAQNLDDMIWVLSNIDSMLADSHVPLILRRYIRRYT